MTFKALSNRKINALVRKYEGHPYIGLAEEIQAELARLNQPSTSSAKDSEGDLFSRCGALIDEHRERGMGWSKIHGVMATLAEVAKFGLHEDLLLFSKEKP